ncbi:MAG: RnfABCDGE type electron transport complex subunit G [Bacteroidaceae bacterium]|nr:RnfABCDGE type electron transport complex subunit G [Bacteroidaceae bacterium]
MKKLKSNITNMVLVLSLISVVAAALLALVNQITSGPIEKINAETLANGIKQVIVGDEEIEFTVSEPIDKDGFLFYKVYNSDSELLGTAVKSTDGNAFGGNLVVLVGFNPDGTILGYEVLEHAETPGLGALAVTWFKQASSASDKKQSKFVDILFGAPGKAGNHNIVGMNPADGGFTVTKDGGKIDAITASTITSRAFLRAVENAYKALFTDGNVDNVSGATVQN